MSAQRLRRRERSFWVAFFSICRTLRASAAASAAAAVSAATRAASSARAFSSASALRCLSASFSLFFRSLPSSHHMISTRTRKWDIHNHLLSPKQVVVLQFIL